MISEPTSPDPFHPHDWLKRAPDADLASALAAPELASVHIARSAPDALAELHAWSLTSSAFEIARPILVSGPDLAALVAPLPAGPAQDWLHEDIRALVSAFGRVSGDAVVHVGLALTRQDECKRFHYDAIRLRMLCTYLGPGTQWLPAHATNLEAVGSLRHTAQQVIADPEAIREAATHDLLWMKGDRYAPGHAACVHRSPPIRHMGLTRLVLRISTPDSPMPYAAS